MLLQSQEKQKRGILGRGSRANVERCCKIKVNEKRKKGRLLVSAQLMAQTLNTRVLMERWLIGLRSGVCPGTEYFKSLGRAIGEFIDGKPTVQRFEQVGA